MNGEGTVIKIPEWKNLYDAVSSWEYGSIHTHHEVSDILGIPYGDPRYYDQVNRAKADLIDIGRVIKCVQNVGYKLIEPDEYVPHSSEYVKKGVQKVIDAERIIVCSPVEIMSIEERTRADRHREDLTSLRVLIVPKSYSIIRKSRSIQQPEERRLLNE